MKLCDPLVARDLPDTLDSACNMVMDIYIRLMFSWMREVDRSVTLT